MMNSNMVNALQTLNKPLNLLMLTIIVRSVLEDEGKFYSQVYSDESLYQL